MKDLYIKKTMKDVNNILEITYELKYKDTVIATSVVRCNNDAIIGIEADIDARNRKILLDGVKVIDE